MHSHLTRAETVTESRRCRACVVFLSSETTTSTPSSTSWNWQTNSTLRLLQRSQNKSNPTRRPRKESHHSRRMREGSSTPDWGCPNNRSTPAATSLPLSLSSYVRRQSTFSSLNMLTLFRALQSLHCYGQPPTAWFAALLELRGVAAYPWEGGRRG